MIVYPYVRYTTGHTWLQGDSDCTVMIQSSTWTPRDAASTWMNLFWCSKNLSELYFSCSRWTDTKKNTMVFNMSRFPAFVVKRGYTCMLVVHAVGSNYHQKPTMIIKEQGSSACALQCLRRWGCRSWDCLLVERLKHLKAAEIWSNHR